MNFTPVSGFVMVKLDTSPYETIVTETDKYDSANTGLVVDYGEYPEFEDKKIIWMAYREKDATFSYNGEQYAMIGKDKICGVSE